MADEERGSAQQLSSRPIQRLPDDVVNRIAAGEVVVSPAAALKELLENSIDAGARSITVAVRGGGAKLLQVIDDGRGIPPEDLPLLCERHATSKLRTFDDLAEVATFGFRGEALASVSHVARVSVRTKTVDAKCASFARYLDGALIVPPSSTAGLDGTALSVEDLFYNLPTRRRALRPPSEEYRSIVDIVARYAIKYCNIAFVCKRLPDTIGTRGRSGALGGPDVRTESDSSVLSNIRAAFGATVAQELVEFEVCLEKYGIAARVYASKPGFSMRKGVFVIFINGRLVNCSPVKRAVDSAYAAYLPKGGHAFMYIDVTMRVRDVDVNVHPNKMEVRFLHESELVDALMAALDARLKSDGRSRTFLAQALIGEDGNLHRPLASPAGPSAALVSRMPRERAACSQDPVEDVRPRKRSRALFRSESERVDSLIETEALDSRGVVDEKQSSGDEPDEEDMAFIVGDEECVDGGSSMSSLHFGREEVFALSGDDGVSVEDGGAVDVESPEAAIPSETMHGSDAQETSTSLLPPSGKKAKPAPKDVVRTGRVAPAGALDAFMAHGDAPSVALDLRKRRQRRPTALPMLTSLSEAIDTLRTNAHRGLLEMVRSHTFVGIASERYALIQHQTKLILVDIAPVISELFFRQVLMRFADLDAIELDPPGSLLNLLSLVDDSSRIDCPATAGGSYAIGSPTAKARACVTLLLEKAPLLDEYFSIVVSGSTVEDAKLSQVPLIFAGVWPDLSSAPEFFLRIVDLDWTAEQPCLIGIARALADWYADGWRPSEGSYLEPDTNECGDKSGKPIGDMPNSGPTQTLSERKEWLLRHVLFESLRFDFDPPSHLAKAFREITSTQRLYRIFERC